MKKQCWNPYLPLDEYIPDGEPHVFDNRLYLFGSHDKENGDEFCELDYVAYSAPLSDLSDWKYEGIIYRKEQDLDNTECYPLYAPDVCQGPDGRYYLYYCVKFKDYIGVAVCDTPAGRYEYLGKVCYRDYTVMTDNQPYDPSIIYVDDRVYLYFGFAPVFLDIPRYRGQDLRGCSVIELEKDMLTVKEGPKVVIPSEKYAMGTSFEKNAYFEAPSVRKIGELFYLVYSSVHTHQLCYAISRNPVGDFVYGGVIVSNGDVGYLGRKEEDKLMSVGNNHGGLVEIDGQWYIFYHRHTHTNQYNRQGCAEKIVISEEGKINQVTVTTSGMNPYPLAGRGSYPAVICCNLTNGRMGALSSIGRKNHTSDFPYITNVGEERFITNIRDGVLIGYKYLNLVETRAISVLYRGNAEGTLEIRTAINDQTRTNLKLIPNSNWTETGIKITFSPEEKELYFLYHGGGSIDLLKLILE